MATPQYAQRMVTESSGSDRRCEAEIAPFPKTGGAALLCSPMDGRVERPAVARCASVSRTGRPADSSAQQTPEEVRKRVLSVAGRICRRDHECF
jgi:hypothetical protein